MPIVLRRRSINSDYKLVIRGSRSSVIIYTGFEAILLAILLNYLVNNSYSSRLGGLIYFAYKRIVRIVRYGRDQKKYK